MCALQIAGNGGQCCECPQLTGCDCGGIACSLTCESRAGDAELCGFEEFVASLPPKLYRRRVRSGTLYRGLWEVAGCPNPSEPNNSGTFCTAFPATEAIPGGHSLCFSVNAADQGDGNYILNVTKDGDPNQGQLWSRWFSGGLILGQSLSSFSTDPISPAVDGEGRKYFDMGMQSFNGSSWITGDPTTHRMYVGLASPTELLRDVWDLEQEYGAEDCVLTEADESTRHKALSGVFPLSAGGDEQLGGPATASYDGLSDETLEATERAIKGTDECEDLGGGDYGRLQGTFSEVLTEEDTDADAEARAAAAVGDWSACLSGCAACSAFRVSRGAGVFEFAFRQQRVKASWTAVPGNTYKVTVRFVRRVLGSAGPAVFYALEERTILADVEGEETDWIDVPSEAGWETWAANCSVEDIT